MLWKFGIEPRKFLVHKDNVILDLASLKVDICRTKRARHAYDHTFSLDINEYCGIICSSGDGILHEVINAIFHREDRDAFMHNVPIGSIPGGTSNGFAKTVCDVSGEECTPENCAYIVTKGEVRDFDIQEIETISGEKNYSMLMISWGIIADIDLESET